jgi:hypothetical protein
MFYSLQVLGFFFGNMVQRRESTIPLLKTRGLYIDSDDPEANVYGM